MKYQQLKKQLIKQSAIVILIFFASVGTTGGLYWMSAGYLENNVKLKNEAVEISAAATQLQDKYNKIQQNMSLYKEAVAKNEAGRFSIGHKFVEDVFNKLNDKFYLNSLHLTMGGVDEVKNPAYKHPNGTIVYSEVTVNFQAIADEYVYDMLDQMQQDLPGATRLTSLSLKREGDIASALQSISQRGTASLVFGEMKFLWFGIRPIDAKAVKTAEPDKVQQKK